MPLSSAGRKHLRGLAHDLHPYVTVGDRGLSDTVLEEIESALAHHELVKIRVNEADRAARAEVVRQITDRTGSEVVMSVGRTASLYRRNPDDPKIRLPA